MIDIDSDTPTKNLIVFFFRSDHIDDIKYGCECPMCHYWNISGEYTNIINQLKKAGLLSDRYTARCCSCYSLLKKLYG